MHPLTLIKKLLEAGWDLGQVIEIVNTVSYKDMDTVTDEMIPLYPHGGSK